MEGEYKLFSYITTAIALQKYFVFTLEWTSLTKDTTKKTHLSSLFAENTACRMLCCLRVSSKHAQKRLTIGYCSTVLTNVDIIHNVPSVRIMLQLGILYIKETSNWIPDKCGKCWICVVAPQTYEDILWSGIVFSCVLNTSSHYFYWSCLCLHARCLQPGGPFLWHVPMPTAPVPFSLSK